MYSIHVAWGRLAVSTTLLQPHIICRTRCTVPRSKPPFNSILNCVAGAGGGDRAEAAPGGGGGPGGAQDAAGVPAQPDLLGALHPGPAAPERRGADPQERAPPDGVHLAEADPAGEGPGTRVGPCVWRGCDTICASDAPWLTPVVATCNPVTGRNGDFAQVPAASSDGGWTGPVLEQSLPALWCFKSFGGTYWPRVQ
jgi:hypothetical protein